MKRLYKYILTGWAVFSLLSCEKLVEGLEKDPNNPSDAPTELMLTGAQVGIASLMEGELSRLASMWTGQFTGTDRQYVPLANYNTTAGDFDTPWANVYYTLAQLRIIQAKSVARNEPYQRGIAQVLEAYLMGTTAALWGNVPFSQAADDNNRTPVYDSQSAVYASVQTLLDQAIVNLNAASGISPGARDILYGGNRPLWRLAANTLKARFYLHTKQYANAVTAATNGISSPASSMYITHGDAYLQNFNFWYSFLVYDRAAYMGASNENTGQRVLGHRLLDATSANYRGNAKTDESGRFGYYYLDGAIGEGIYTTSDPNFLTDFDWGTPTTFNGFFAANKSYPLITYEENQLILAEANARLNNLPAALTALNNVRAFLDAGTFLLESTDYNVGNYDAYVLADFSAAGMENSNGALTQQNAMIREILEERYLTLFGQIEVFNDVRRTASETTLRVPVLPNAGSSIPQRLLYPQNEINTNSANVPSPLPGLFDKTQVFQ